MTPTRALAVRELRAPPGPTEQRRDTATSLRGRGGDRGDGVEHHGFPATRVSCPLRY
ncbi:MAG: hypothetical protein IT529_10525 [Burkholderiales bacterium]|nr:hypothetical protein [Burkholderiales bacterium]